MNQGIARLGRLGGWVGRRSKVIQSAKNAIKVVETHQLSARLGGYLQ